MAPMNGCLVLGKERRGLKENKGAEIKQVKKQKKLKMIKKYWGK